MNKKELQQILQSHAAWLRGEPGGKRADLSGADLRGANLSGADLRGVDLRGVDLRGADLREADLRRADLNGTDLRDAEMKGARLPNFLIVPEIGQFYGFKKLQGDVIATLLIPKSAKRTNSLVGRKCRASKVKVVALSKGKKAVDRHTGQLEYEVGKWIVPDKYDDDIRLECTNGIHFFITRKEAEEYA